METHNLLSLLRIARQETYAIKRRGNWKNLKYNDKLGSHLKQAEKNLKNAIEHLEELELAEQLESVERENRK